MRVRSLLAGVFATALLTACASPYLETEGVRVYVLSDYFHSGILIQEGTPPEYTYTFITFGDRAWYGDGERGFWVGARAALQPTDGVVAVGTMMTGSDVTSILGEIRLGSTPNGWLFRVPPDALDRALHHLRSEIMTDPDTPLSQSTSGGFTYSFFGSQKPYHMFYSCVQFTAEFLTVAGVDFEPIWYFYTNAILRGRLNELTEMAF